MRPTELRFDEPQMQALFKAITSVLVNISADNFRAIELTGTTNATANTQQKFRHNLGKNPAFWFPLEGRVYVPRHGTSESELDIRSTVASEPFRVLVVA